MGSHFITILTLNFESILYESLSYLIEENHLVAVIFDNKRLFHFII